MRFDIYKRGQGKYTRLCSAFGAAIIVALGSWRLYKILDGNNLNQWVSTMVPAGVLLVFCLLIFWLVNKHSVADFMISAEGEIKKVSWSSRKEIAASTFIVISLVIFMGVLLGITDLLFRWFFIKFLGL